MEDRLKSTRRELPVNMRSSHAQRPGPRRLARSNHSQPVLGLDRGQMTQRGSAVATSSAGSLSQELKWANIKDASVKTPLQPLKKKKEI